MNVVHRAGWFLSGLLLFASVCAQQMADPDFDPAVADPAYRRGGPTVAIDEAHANFHTVDGRYKPFADLLRADGYRVVAGTQRFDRKSLAGIDVLVIANAGNPEADEAAIASAFDDAECDAVRDWVRRGGALLLVADHAPFGAANENLAGRFGVGMGKGYAIDAAHSDRTASTLVYSRDNGLLGTHVLLDGRTASEAVSRVITFTGQSLVAPRDATILLKLGPGAREAASREALMASEADPTSAPPAAGNAQGLALELGRGRVVVLGEAAMLSAQVIRFEENGATRTFKMGMNVPGNDDRQFALNLMHWLSRKID